MARHSIKVGEFTVVETMRVLWEEIFLPPSIGGLSLRRVLPHPLRPMSQPEPRVQL